ncbi:FAD linked oxidase [Gongronella butleri]|nr:FAD linked oxidase [Gongronella butleri]
MEILLRLRQNNGKNTSLPINDTLRIYRNLLDTPESFKLAVGLGIITDYESFSDLHGDFSYFEGHCCFDNVTSGSGCNYVLFCRDFYSWRQLIERDFVDSLTRDAFAVLVTATTLIVSFSGTIQKLNGYLGAMMEYEIAQDGVVAQDETQSESIWGVREGLIEALGKEGTVYKYDISMPVPKINGCVLDMRDHLEKGGVFGKPDSLVIDVVGHGHVGDRNLHLNIPDRQADSRVMELIEPYLFEWVAKQKGYISAKHGLGVSKNEYLSYSKSDSMIKLMKAFKNMLDRNGILNPYKYLPSK